jgi:lactate permease
MYQQVYDPVSESLGLSAIFAVIPLVTLFVLLGGLKLKAHWAGLASLFVAIVVAVAVYAMPVGQAALSATEGAAFGLFPIMWIVVNAIWIYNMTVESGHFAVLRRSFSKISDDQRVQAVIIAFCFGALLEALAGFGTPVAITAVMLIALGFKPMQAAAVALVANTAPVAFGAIAIPIVTLAEITGLPRRTSARWSDARRRCSRSSSRSSSSAWSTGAAASARPGLPRSSAASCSPSRSSCARTSSPSS